MKLFTVDSMASTIYRDNQLGDMVLADEKPHVRTCDIVVRAKTKAAAIERLAAIGAGHLRPADLRLSRSNAASLLTDAGLFDEDLDVVVCAGFRNTDRIILVRGDSAPVFRGRFRYDRTSNFMLVVDLF